MGSFFILFQHLSLFSRTFFPWHHKEFSSMSMRVVAPHLVQLRKPFPHVFKVFFRPTHLLPSVFGTACLDFGIHLPKN